MVSLNDLQCGWLYFYEFEGDIGIGEYIEEWDDNWVDKPENRYLSDVWCDDESELTYNTYINSCCDTINIIKEISNAYEEYNLDQILVELREEYPEYFI